LYSFKVELSEAVELEAVEVAFGAVEAVLEPLVIGVANTGRSGTVVSEEDDTDSAPMVDSVAKDGADEATVSAGAVGARTVDLSVSKVVMLR
jgi:hypothetical protein